MAKQIHCRQSADGAADQRKSEKGNLPYSWTMMYRIKLINSKHSECDKIYDDQINIHSPVSDKKILKIGEQMIVEIVHVRNLSPK